MFVLLSISIFNFYKYESIYVMTFVMLFIIIASKFIASDQTEALWVFGNLLNEHTNADTCDKYAFQYVY